MNNVGKEITNFKIYNTDNSKFKMFNVTLNLNSFN